MTSPSCNSASSRHANVDAPPRIAILVVAFKSQEALSRVLDRIPDEVWARVAEVLVCQDADATSAGLRYVRGGIDKLRYLGPPEVPGYGSAQAQAFQYALEQSFDVVALLHGEGRYAPEALPALLEPLLTGRADAVFGSRMTERGVAPKPGMPVYKFVGNRLLSTLENVVLAMNLTEFHSGYRAYNVNALREIPFQKNTADLHFDTQIIIQLKAAQKRIVEVPIPTYDSDEIGRENGVRYVKDVVVSLVQYRAHELGLTHRPEYAIKPTYKAKQSPLGSQSQLLEWVPKTARRVLDLGCGEGSISRALIERGHHVVSVDSRPPTSPLPNFVQADIGVGLPLDPDDRFDVIVLADVLEHLPQPEQLLETAVAHLAPGGRLLVSLPNFVHWSVRASVLAGKFEYTNRGILDRTHLRFFTKRTATQLFNDAGLHIQSYRTTPVPWELVLPKPVQGAAASLERADHLLTRARPDLFAYQHLFELTRAES
jgi:2-polyprenyl-3-methyl-5-hydroxy-6-metoxy-1,4-benzoquinol methylase